MRQTEWQTGLLGETFESASSRARLINDRLENQWKEMSVFTSNI